MDVLCDLVESMGDDGNECLVCGCLVMQYHKKDNALFNLFNELGGYKCVKCGMKCSEERAF